MTCYHIYSGSKPELKGTMIQCEKQPCPKHSQYVANSIEEANILYGKHNVSNDEQHDYDFHDEHYDDIIHDYDGKDMSELYESDMEDEDNEIGYKNLMNQVHDYQANITLKNKKDLKIINDYLTVHGFNIDYDDLKTMNNGSFKHSCIVSFKDANMVNDLQSLMNDYPVNSIIIYEPDKHGNQEMFTSNVSMDDLLDLEDFDFDNAYCTEIDNGFTKKMLFPGIFNDITILEKINRKYGLQSYKCNMMSLEKER